LYPSKITILPGIPHIGWLLPSPNEYAIHMPSVDILSKVDIQMLDNAINVVKREIDTRYDLRGTNSTVELDKKALTIRLSTEDHMKLDAVLDILLERSGKQKVDVRSYDLKEEPVPSGKTLYRIVKVKQGIERETAKKIVKAIKDSGLKVQPQIMDDLIRVNGKKIDDLQAVMALCREKDFEIPLQFDNMKS
jgi:cyclic-di-GMP-binding protein